MQPEFRLLESETLGANDDAVIAFLPTGTTSAQQGQAMVLAQTFDQDIIGDLGSAWNTFIQSGQIWALLIGFVLGYLLRGVTTYK